MSRFIIVLAVLLAVVGFLPAAHEWRAFPGGSEWALWIDGQQAGNYSGHKYYPRLSPGKWGKPSPLPAGVDPPAGENPPVKDDCCGGDCKCKDKPCKKPDCKCKNKQRAKDECPCCGEGCMCAIWPCQKPNCHCVLSAGVIDANGKHNYGVDTSKLHKDKGKHVLNGKEVSKEAVMEAIGKPTLPDDAGQMYLTVIGPEASRKAVLSDLTASPALSMWKGKVKIHDYEPTHWAVVQEGFKSDGKPTIYVQAPDGKVLHRQDEYRGAAALAEVLSKAQQNYQYQKDPDLNKQSVPLWVLAAGGVLVLLLLKGEGQ